MSVIRYKAEFLEITDIPWKQIYNNAESSFSHWIALLNENMHLKSKLFK